MRLIPARSSTFVVGTTAATWRSSVERWCKLKYRDPHNEYIDAIQNWAEFLEVLDAWMDTTDRYLWAESAPELFSHTGRYSGWARVLAKWILDNTKIPPDLILEIARAIQAKDPLGEMTAFALAPVDIERLLVKWRPYQQLLIQQAVAAEEAAISTPAGGTKKKRNTTPGAADTAILSALCRHHEFRDGGCGNWDPIGGNALARLAECSSGAVTNFWKRRLASGDRKGTIEDYKRACGNQTLHFKLSFWRGEIPSSDVLPLLADRDDDD